MNYEEKIREASEGQKIIQNNTGTFTEFFVFFIEFFFVFYRFFFLFVQQLFSFYRDILNLRLTFFSDLITAEKKGLTEKCDVIQVRSLNICVCTYDI